MANENALRLASALLEKTKQQQLNWEEDPFYNGYTLAMKRGKCKIYIDEDGNINLSIYNENDMPIEKIEEYSIKNEIIFDAYALRELYDTARRNALKSDTVIEDMLKELDSGDWI